MSIVIVTSFTCISQSIDISTVIVASPSVKKAVTTPFSSTVATLGLLETHVSENYLQLYMVLKLLHIFLNH